MRVVKERIIDMTADEIMAAVKNGTIPAGIAIDVCGDTITVSHSDKVNLFGESADDYETIFCKE